MALLTALLLVAGLVGTSSAGFPDRYTCWRWPAGHNDHCDKCNNGSEWWYSYGMYKCGREPRWPDGKYCLAGTTCNRCKNSYSWWQTGHPHGNRCGFEPCWKSGSVCGAGTTCNKCCGRRSHCPWYWFGVCKCNGGNGRSVVDVDRFEEEADRFDEEEPERFDEEADRYDGERGEAAEAEVYIGSQAALAVPIAGVAILAAGAVCYVIRKRPEV